MEISPEFWQAKLLTIHILGTVLGLGGATISDILFFKFLGDFRISQKESEVMNVLKNIILIALMVIIVSGVGLYLQNPETYRSSSAFLFKVTIVGIVTLNGIGLHLWVAPRLLHFNFDRIKINRYWHKLAFVLGAISAVSWYTIFFTAMLKKWILWEYSTLLLLYTSILLFAVAVGQVAEVLITKKAQS